MSNKEARTSLLNDAYEQSYQPYVPQYDQHNEQPYAGGYFQREGYGPAPATPQSPKEEPWVYVPTSKWTLAFLAIVFCQALIGLGLEAYIFGKFQLSLESGASKESAAKTVPTYLSLYIFGFIYQLFLVYDALRLKNTIQIVGLCLYNVGLLAEAAVQIDQIHDAVNYLAAPPGGAPLIEPNFWSTIHSEIIAVPCIIALATLLMIGVSWKLYGEFAWSIYKNISADLRLKTRFRSYQIYIALLKFDFFFFLAFTIQFLVVVSNTTNLEFWLTIAAIPLTVVLLFFAAYWVRKETLIGMVIIIIVYFAALAYFLYKLVRMYDGPRDRVLDYLPARRSLTTFAVITVILLVVTIVYAVICTINFGKGLKPYVMSNRQRRKESVDLKKLYSGNSPLAAPGSSRMEID